MARIRTRTHSPHDRAELAETKVMRQGGFEDEYWDEDEMVDRRPGSKKKKAARSSRGCEGNEGKAHVYTWTVEFEPTGWYKNYYGNVYASFYEKHGFHQHERKVCVGCGKKTGYRKTPEYAALIAKVGWHEANYGK